MNSQHRVASGPSRRMRFTAPDFGLEGRTALVRDAISNRGVCSDVLVFARFDGDGPFSERSNLFFRNHFVAVDDEQQDAKELEAAA